MPQIEGIAKNPDTQKGCTPIFTKDGLTREEFLPKGNDKWTPYVFDEVKELNPDIAVVDFMTFSGIKAVDDLKIPIVINLPGPINVLNFLLEAKLPSKNNTFSCCGFLCVR